MATVIVSLLVFLVSCGGLALGQCFGRAPIEGRCRPRGVTGCGSPNCCRRGANRETA